MEYSPFFVSIQHNLSAAPLLLAFIFSICSSAPGQIFLIFPKSHYVELDRNKIETLQFSLFAGAGSMSCSAFVVLSQGSCHRSICFPSPTSQPEFLLIRSRPISMPFHPWDSDDLLWHSNKFPAGQYFLRRTCPSNLWGLLIILQLSLPKKASLKLSKSSKPKPPFPFGCANLFHETQAIFFFPVLSSHRKRVTADWIRLIKDMGSLKQVMAWEGIGERMLFSITNFPAEDKNRFDQPLAYRSKQVPFASAKLFW